MKNLKPYIIGFVSILLYIAFLYFVVYYVKLFWVGVIWFTAIMVCVIHDSLDLHDRYTAAKVRRGTNASTAGNSPTPRLPGIGAAIHSGIEREGGDSSQKAPAAQTMAAKNPAASGDGEGLAGPFGL